MRAIRFIAAALLIAAAPALAEDELTRLDPAGREVLAKFAACLVDAKAELARQAVLEDWDGRTQGYRDLLTERRCARGRVFQFHASVLKSAMAGELAKRELGPIDVQLVPAAPPLSYKMPEPVSKVDGQGKALSDMKVKRQEEAVARKLHWVIINQFGECVVRANPAAVPPLLNASVALDAEMAAIKAFGEQMPACLPKGVKLELDRSTMRNSITLAYYRLAMAARGGAMREAAK